MRTLPLVLVAAAALLSPAAALAGGASAPAARYFVITGLVLGDQKADASGKMGIEGEKFFASVGCNTIGGTVSVDGDTVTIVNELAMTEMACEGAIGATEDFFVKVLAHGVFHITATAWDADGASIMTTELPTGPGPNASGAPDDPVGSSPGPVIVDPGMSCPPFDAGSGSTGSGGSTGGGVVPPDAGSGSGSSSGGSAGGGDMGTGSAPTSTAVAGPGTTTEEPPTPPDPAGTPGPDESPTLGQTEPDPSLPTKPEPSGVVIEEPAPSAIAMPDPGTGVEPGSSFNIDPGIGKPIPIDGCERYYAVDQGLGTSGGVPPKAGDAAAEHAVFGVSAASITPPVGAALLALFVLGAVGARRWWATARR